jgi:uncharacterized protein (TIGR00369 family)
VELDIERLWRGWKRSPYHAFLEIELTGFDREAGTATFSIPFKETYKRTPGEEGIHGGVLAGIIDITADFALAVAMNRMGFPTIDLRVDYLRMAGDGDMTAQARTIKKGRTIGVADVEVFDTKGRLCAVGRGTYATSA